MIRSSFSQRRLAVFEFDAQIDLSLTAHLIGPAFTNHDGEGDDLPNAAPEAVASFPDKASVLAASLDPSDDDIIVNGRRYRRSEPGYGDIRTASGQLISDTLTGLFDAFGDDDHDGIENQFEEIVVTGQWSQREAAIASELAGRDVAASLAFYGFFVGLSGFELTAALELLGVSRAIAAGLGAAITANNGGTSIADILALSREALYQTTFNRYANDIHNHPENYENYLVFPNGEIYDMNDFDN
jgi:hypothetical protein